MPDGGVAVTVDRLGGPPPRRARLHVRIVDVGLADAAAVVLGAATVAGWDGTSAIVVDVPARLPPGASAVAEVHLGASPDAVAVGDWVTTRHHPVVDGRVAVTLERVG